MIRELTEVTVRFQPESSSLAAALERTANSGAEVTASCSYWDRFGMVLMLVANKPDALERTLLAAGFKPHRHSVLVVGPQEHLGVGPVVCLQLARAGIGILYSYASWSETGRGLYVFNTTDNSRAQRLLSADPALDELERVHLWDGKAAARRLKHDPFVHQQQRAA